MAIDPLMIVHAWHSADGDAVLDELEREPLWPLELGVFLACELPPLTSCVWQERPRPEGLAARVEQVVARRFGPEAFERLWQAVTLFDLPEHTFVNQGLNYWFLMPRSLVDVCAAAARSLAPVLAAAARLEAALLAELCEIADIVWSQYELEAAGGLFEILLESLPAADQPGARFTVADCHFMLGVIDREHRPEQAAAHFTRFLELAPRASPDNNWPLYPSYFPRMRHAPSSVAAWAELGRLTLRISGDRARARACFEAAIDLAPASQEAPYRELGELLAEDGRIEAALHSYRTALAVRSRALVSAEWSWLERPYRRELAALCLRMLAHVDEDEARALLRRALQLDPDDAARWLGPLAAIFEDMPTLAQQQRVCVRALSLAQDIPMDGATLHAIKVDMRFRALFLEIAEGFVAEPGGCTRALAWCERAREVAGDSPALLRRESEWVEATMHDPSRVQALCERYLAMKPGDPEVRARWLRAGGLAATRDEPGDVGSARVMLVVTPRSVRRAAEAAVRLRREAWLDAPFIFYDPPEPALARIIEEDLRDFPPAVMSEAREIAAVLREQVVRHAGPLPRWAFYPQTTVDGLEAVLVGLGYRLLLPDLSRAE